MSMMLDYATDPLGWRIARSLARWRGHTQYIGPPCKRCSEKRRYVTSGRCVNCDNNAQKAQVDHYNMWRRDHRKKYPPTREELDKAKDKAAIRRSKNDYIHHPDVVSSQQRASAKQAAIRRNTLDVMREMGIRI